MERGLIGWVWDSLVILIFMLVQAPNHEDPLNHEAGAFMRDHLETFQCNVKKSIEGGYVGSTYFPGCLSK